MPCSFRAVSYTHLDVYKRQVHEGAAVRQMEKRGIQTNIGNLNREIRAANRLMKSIRQLIDVYKRQVRSCLAVTATRQSATAREPPVSSGRPPRNTAAMWKPWKI